MANFNIGTGMEQPINRTGLDNLQVSPSEDTQGLLLSVDNSGSEPQLVEADATTGRPAVGVLLQQEVYPDGYYADFGDHDLTEELAQLRAERDLTTVGDRGTIVRYGIELVNDGADMDLTPGEPVYLAEGGGMTQTQPSSAGSVVQAIGVALTPEDYGRGEGYYLGQQEDATGPRERVLLDIDSHYTTV